MLVQVIVRWYKLKRRTDNQNVTYSSGIDVILTPPGFFGVNQLWHANMEDKISKKPKKLWDEVLRCQSPKKRTVINSNKRQQTWRLDECGGRQIRVALMDGQRSAQAKIMKRNEAAKGNSVYHWHKIIIFVHCRQQPRKTATWLGLHQKIAGNSQLMIKEWIHSEDIITKYRKEKNVRHEFKSQCDFGET